METIFFEQYSPSVLYEKSLSSRYCFYENTYHMQLDLPYVFPSEAMFHLKSFMAMCKESSKGDYSTGDYEEVWVEGKLRARGSFRNGRPCGIWRFFHDNGTCAEIVNLRDEGDIFAHHYLFYPNEVMSFAFEHSCPGATGVLKEWFPNGQVKSRINVHKGNLQGMCRRWHENGQLESEGEFLNGRRAGNYKQWNTSGVLAFERVQTFNTTLHCEKIFNDEGKIVRSTSYKDDQLHGEEVRYFDYDHHVMLEKPQVNYYLNNTQVPPGEFFGRTGVIN